MMTKILVGDIYKLGRHRLMCGNSTLQSDLNILMDGQVADALVTDPPYSSGGQYTSDRQRTTNEKNIVTGT